MKNKLTAIIILVLIIILNISVVEGAGKNTNNKKYSSVKNKKSKSSISKKNTKKSVVKKNSSKSKRNKKYTAGNSKKKKYTASKNKKKAKNISNYAVPVTNSGTIIEKSIIHERPTADNEIEIENEIAKIINNAEKEKIIKNPEGHEVSEEKAETETVEINKNTEKQKLKSFAGVLADESGHIIEGYNYDAVHPIASLTKMMTALIVLEQVKNGTVSMNDKVKIPAEATKLGESSSALKKGEVMTLEDLFKGAVIKSGNDAAYTLAWYVGGENEKWFIDRMNKRARELGMVNTRYFSSSGLPPRYYLRAGIDKSLRGFDVSTAKDLALLSAELVKYPKYIETSSLYYSSIKNGRIKIRNHNGLLLKYEGVDGLKTGFHNTAKYNIAVTAKKDGKRIITVVLGSKTLGQREKEVVDTLNEGFDRYGLGHLIPKHYAKK